MLRRAVSMLAVVSLIALGLSISAQADTISYNETFQNPFSSTTSSFTGSASPNPTWTLTSTTAAVASAGTLSMSTTSNDARALVSAAGLLGGGATTFDVSNAPLTVTETLSITGNGTPTWNNGDPAGWADAGIVIGGLQILAWPGLQLERVISNGGVNLVNDSGFAASFGTPFTVSATLSAKDSNNYTLIYSFDGNAANTLTVAKTDVGPLSSVGINYSDKYGATASVTRFSVSQAVPEPGTLALLATGLIGLLAYAWRKRR